MKKEIKNYAVKNHIKNFKERCGLPSERIDTSILKEVSLLLPKHHLPEISGSVDSIETNGFAVETDSYYPRKSFYRVSIVYSGNIPEEKREDKKYGFFFRNATVHYDEDLNFIEVQPHHNQSDYNWADYFSKFKEIFANL